MIPDFGQEICVMKLKTSNRYFLGAAVIFGLGLLAGTFLSPVKRNTAREHYDERTLRDLYYHVWESGTGELRFYANVLWGDLGRRATIRQLEFFIAMWIYYGSRASDERFQKILEKNADIVFRYMENRERRDWFFSTFDLSEKQKTLINDACVLGESREKSPLEENENFRVQTRSSYKEDGLSRFSFKKNVVEENNKFRSYGDDVSETEIEYSTYYQYEAKGKTKCREDGTYELLYLIPENRLIVCPMDKCGFLRDEIYIVPFACLSIDGDGTWSFEK